MNTIATSIPAIPKDRVEALAPMVARLREQFDTDRRLPDALILALRQTDLFRLTTPKSSGGMQLSLRDWLGVVEAAARLDASLAWVLTNTAVMGRFGRVHLGLDPRTVRF